MGSTRHVNVGPRTWKFHIAVLVVVSCSFTNAFKLPAWSDIFTSLKPYKDTTDSSAKGNNIRWVETADGDGEFDELRLVEEGEPRYGLVQLGTGSGTAYNVTLNLTGHILMAIGISLYLLMYMWFEAINSDSGGYGRSYGEILRNKRFSDLDESTTIELLRHIVSSLDQSQIEDLAKRFEAKLRKEIKDGGIPDDVAAVHQECIMKFVCQMLVKNYSLPSAAEDPRKSKLLHLLKEKAPSSRRIYGGVPIYNNNDKYPQHDQYPTKLDTISLHEWGEAIKIILDYQFGRYLDEINKVQHGLPLQLSMNENNTPRKHAEVGSKTAKIPATLYKYFEVYMFAESLQSNDRSKLLPSMEDQCASRYLECPLEIK